MKENPAFPFLGGGCPLQASREATGLGWESWWRAALTLRGHKRTPVPRGSPRTQLPPEFGVPRFPLVCLVDSSIFLKMQLRCCLLREVFLSFLRASASPCPSPGLSQPLVLISAQRESLSSAACLPVFFHPPPQCSGRGCLPIPGLLPPGRWQQPVTSTGDCLW